MEYYYHITRKDWPKQIRLLPRTGGKFRGFMETKTARICVCPTPAHCFIAIPYVEGGDMNIYRTLRKCNIKEPIGVLDSCVTLEKWRVEPTWFIKIGSVSPELYKQMELSTIVGSVWGMDRQREALARVERLLAHYGFNYGYGNSRKEQR